MPHPGTPIGGGVETPPPAGTIEVRGGKPIDLWGVNFFFFVLGICLLILMKPIYAYLKTTARIQCIELYLNDPAAKCYSLSGSRPAAIIVPRAKPSTYDRSI